MPDFDIIGQGISGGQPSGLLAPFTPAGQIDQARAALARQQVQQAQAFQNGLPTDAQGNPDYTAAANKLFQLGAYDQAGNLLKAGFQMDAMRSLNGPDPFAGGAPIAGGSGQASAPASVGPSGGAAPSRSANPQVVSFIAQTAQSMGIAPQTALKVAASEGLNGFDPNGSPNLGDGGSSAGPFQLHYGNVAGGKNAVVGLGDDFTAATRLDARDPSTWKQQVVFALQNAKQNGWGAFHGAANSGVGRWEGINQGDGTTPVPAFARGALGSSPPAAPVASAASASPPGGGQPPAPPTPPQTATQSDQVGPNDPVPDSLYQVASRVVGQAQNRDPSTMTLPEQRAVTRAQELVDQYQAQARGGASPTAAAPASENGAAGAPAQFAENGDSDAPAATPHPFGPGAPGLQTPAAASARPVQPPSANGTAGGVPAAPGAPPAMPAPQLAPQALPTRTAFQTALAADPTLGGLLSGQFVGNPSGAINFLRSRQAALGAAGVTAAADAYKARADNIEKTVERLDQLTPEQRNARDPPAIAYEQNRAAYQQQVKDQGELANAGPLAAARAQADLDVKSSPQAIRQAGQIAAATAGGTAQGQAPYDLVPTQPTPGGPTVLAPKSSILSGDAAATQTQPAQFADQQKAIAGNEATMAQQFQKRQVARERIDAMSNLLSTVETGYGTPAFSDALARVRAAGFNIPDSVTANPAAVQQFGKNATANIFSQAGDLGGKVLVSELDGLKQSNANASMQPAANQAILAQQRGILDHEDAYYQAYTAWKGQHPYAVGNDVAQFDTAFAKDNPVSRYVDAAKKDIAPLGVGIPPKDKLVDGQAYMLKGGVKAKWSAAQNGFVPVPLTINGPNAAGAR